MYEPGETEESIFSEMEHTCANSTTQEAGGEETEVQGCS